MNTSSARAQPANPHYKRYHPKWHRARMPIFWWLRSWPYTRFISRELTSLFVGYAAVLLLVQTWMLQQGADTYARFTGWLTSPVVIAWHVVVLLAVLFHALTWLSLAPRAMRLRVAGRRIPDRIVLLGHYLAWLGASGLVAWLLVEI